MPAQLERGISSVSLIGPMKEGQRAKSVAHRANGRKPKLGQHFLTDDSAARRIVEALGDVSQSTVLEIGPGRGVLTSLLAKRARRLIAIELDRVLAAQLRMKFALYPNVEIIEGDVLAIDFGTLFGPKPGAVAARTGAHAGTGARGGQSSVLHHVRHSVAPVRIPRVFETIVIMVQKEVADRLAASPGSRDYGLLSATAQLYAQVENLFTLPPGAFSPPPKVHSSVVRLTMSPQLGKTRGGGRRLHQVSEAFVRTKTQDALEQFEDGVRANPLQDALQAAGVKPTVRAEACRSRKRQRSSGRWRRETETLRNRKVARSPREMTHGHTTVRPPAVAGNSIRRDPITGGQHPLLHCVRGAAGDGAGCCGAACRLHVFRTCGRSRLCTHESQPAVHHALPQPYRTWDSTFDHDRGTWETPLGDVEIDSELADALMRTFPC